MAEQRVIFDQPKQLELIQQGLQQGEQVIAVYDAIGAGTGFIGLTDRRAIIQDNSWFGKQVALVSVPYSRITSVAFVSDKSILGKFFSVSKISILAAGKTFEVEFRGTEKARHVHDLILWKILQ